MFCKSKVLVFCLTFLGVLDQGEHTGTLHSKASKKTQSLADQAPKPRTFGRQVTKPLRFICRILNDYHLAPSFACQINPFPSVNWFSATVWLCRSTFYQIHKSGRLVLYPTMKTKVVIVSGVMAGGYSKIFRSLAWYLSKVTYNSFLAASCFA